jgi:hypothetical protein
MKLPLITAGLALVALVHAQPQTVVSSRAGLLSYAEGQLETTDNPAPKAGQFHLHPNQQLATKRGRAELLLSPTVFLRLADNSLLELTDDTLGASELLLLKGSAVLDAVDFPGGSSVRIRLGQAAVQIHKPGVYRFDADSLSISTYDGRLDVTVDGATFAVKKGKRWSPGLEHPEQFDRKITDRVQRWSARRSLAVAQSNLRLARTTYGPSWRRAARVWLWSVYVNAPAARSQASLN